MAIKWLSQVEYAAHRGVSQPAVAKAIKVGRIAEAIGPDRRINKDLADRLWAQNTHAFRGGKKQGKVITSEPVITAKRRGRPPKAATTAKPAASPAMQRRGRPPKDDGTDESASELAALGITGGKVPTLNASRALYEAYRAKTAKLEYEKMMGALLDREDVKRQAFQHYRSMRDQILAIPGRISAELAAITDTFDIEARISAELEAALSEISQWGRR